MTWTVPQDPGNAPETLLGTEQLESLMNLAAEAPLGCIVEFGVYKGGSAYHLARVAENQGRELYLYDTFTGIPCKAPVDVHEIGDFKETDYETVCRAVPYAKVIQGRFPDSLVPMPPIAFCHVDADQYQSVKDAINILGPLMVRGGAMVFDDTPCLAGAMTALTESGLTYSTTTGNKHLVRF
jgi:hypothetical protein